uniref:guanine nucleotide-binding protein G(I)/G(S)/G(O) subunit gamma-13 n=1 Tax=Myxine glutinosa TaxID=7769 RepID=UPI00358F3339
MDEDDDDDTEDVPTLSRQVEGLKYEVAFKREKASVTLPELVGWVQENMSGDPLLNRNRARDNPWMEKGKCVIL